jgi:hypothetical protein
MPVKPQDQNPDRPAPAKQPERHAPKPTHYGKGAVFNPNAEETQPEEYKERDTGLQKTTKYSVDKH